MIFAISPYAIPLGALLVSVAALFYSAAGFRAKRGSDLISQLYLRIADLEKQVSDFSQQCKELSAELDDVRSENWRLMRRLLKLENGGGKDA